jgi:phage-related protein
MDKAQSDLANAKSQMSAAIGAIANTASTLLGAGFSGVVASLQAIKANVPGAQFAFTALGGAAGLAWDVVSTGANVAWEVMKGVGSFVSGALTAYFGVFQAVAGAAISGVGAAITGIGTIFKSIGGIITGVLSSIAGIASAVFKGIRDLVQDTLNLTVKLGSQIISMASRPLMAILGPSLAAMGRSLFDFGGMIQGSIQAETALTRMNAIVRATGEVAGWSTSQLAKMRENLVGMSGGTVTSGQAAGAQSSLLRYQNVRGDQFAEALTAARDLAAVMGTDLPEAASLLGRALENPLHGMRALREARIYLSPMEEAMIHAAMAAGNFEQAQEVVLNKVRQFAGVAAQLDSGYAGSLNRLTNTWNSIGKSIGDALKPIAQIVTEFLQPIIEGFASSMRTYFGNIASGSRSLLDSAKTWIAENRDTLVGWGLAIGRIVTSVIDTAKNLFFAAGRFIGQVFGGIADDAGVSLSDIPSIVSRVLATIQTGVQNIPLVWKIAWTGIKLGFQEMIDWLKMQFRFFTLWLANQAVQIASASVTMLPDFMDPSGRMHAEAAEQARKSEETTTALRARLEALPTGSPEATALREQLDALTGKFRTLVDTAAQTIKALSAENNARLQNRPGSILQGVGPANPQDRVVPLKFDFQSFGDLWKSVQKSIVGGDMVALTDRIARATERAADGIQQLNGRQAAGPAVAG